MLIWRVLLLLGIFLTAACSAADIPTSMTDSDVTQAANASSTPSSTQFPNVQVVTLAANQADLPPTWTPTYTATITDTPTITPTRTPTPTITPVDETQFCASFRFVFDTTDGQIYRDGDVMTVLLSIDQPEAFLIFGAIYQDGEADDRQVLARASQTGILELRFRPEDFPANGEYLWSASASTWEEGGLCEQTGTFFIDIRTGEPVMGLLAQLRDAISAYRAGLQSAP